MEKKRIAGDDAEERKPRSGKERQRQRQRDSLMRKMKGANYHKYLQAAEHKVCF